MTPHVYDIFKTANEIADKQDRIDYLRSNRNVVVDVLLKMQVDPNITFALPEGKPPFTPSPFDQAQNLYHEIARIQRVFLTGTLPDITPRHREGLFIATLEYLDKDDAILLVAIKDKSLSKLFKNLKNKFILEAFPEFGVTE